jgi:tRNA A-37 threonylcarbamoyl transferase component Bud32/tetratricopeptide (TPR) repeat protein
MRPLRYVLFCLPLFAARPVWACELPQDLCPGRVVQSNDDFAPAPANRPNTFPGSGPSAVGNGVGGPLGTGLLNAIGGATGSDLERTLRNGQRLPNGGDLPEAPVNPRDYDAARDQAKQRQARVVSDPMLTAQQRGLLAGGALLTQRPQLRSEIRVNPNDPGTGGVPVAAAPVAPIALPTPRETADLAAHWQYGAETGDYSGAQRYIEESLQRHPEHAGLKQYQRLIEQKVKMPDSKALKAKIDALAYEPQAGADPNLAGVMSLGGPGAAPQGAFAPGALGMAAPRDGGQSVAAPSVRPAGGAAPAVREAFRLIHIGDALKAERTLLRHLENEPKDAEAWRMLALAQYKQKRYADSIESANGALALDRRDYHARGLKIRDLMGLERWLDAENEASTLLEDRPRDPWAFTWRADAREAQGKVDAALEDRKTAAEIDPDNFASLYEEALHARAGKKAPALPAALGKRSALLIGALGTAFLFLSFAVYRKRGDSSVRVALRQTDHDAAVAAAPRVDAVPQGFQVVKTLGAGGMGVVYEAVDLALQRTVALKKMRDEVAANPRERARFLKEARVVAALRHPHIVEIYSIQENSDGLFLVFERVPGETLHERLGQGALRPADALPLLRQVAAALDYAHSQGVVHQDLKPANIMVHGGAVKVMDFGIARRVQETLSTMSRVEVAGTPAYMSPEQEQGGAVGPAADLFALGVCAYEMLTGRLPFPQGGLAAKAQGLYLPASQDTPLPKGVDGELARALAAAPQGRHASATAFVDALARALA